MVRGWFHRGWFAEVREQVRASSRKFADGSRMVRVSSRASSRKFADGSRKFAGGSRGSRTFTITIYDSSRMVLEVLTDGPQRFAAGSQKLPSVLD